MIYVLAGANAFQIQLELKQLQADFVQQYGSDAVDVRAGDTLNPDEMTSLFGGVSLFSTRRFVIIRYLSENKTATERFLDVYSTIPDTVMVILVEGPLDKRTAYYKTLKKLKTFHEYNQPSEQELSLWVKDSIAREQATITPGAVRALLLATGADQSRLSHELAKLTAYTSNIDEQAVQELVESNPQDSIFALLDAVLGGKQQLAQQLLTRLEEAHEDPFQVANMLIWQVHILAMVVSGTGVGDADIATKGKVSPFVVKKTRTLAQKIDTHQLQTIIDVVAQLDISLKTSATNPWHLLYSTLLSLK